MARVERRIIMRQAPVSTETIATRHLMVTGTGFWVALAVLLAGSFLVFSQFARQIEEGHAVTGQGSHGAIWGVIVANIVNFVGISHVGIAISAVVRILNLKRYQQLARIAELVTLAAMTTAVLNIAMDVGRPERFITNVVWLGRWHSPFVWSATVITTYIVGSSVYLYLAMRRDLAKCAHEVPTRRRLYSLLAFGYKDSAPARKRHDRVVWWMAVIILPIMVSVHSVYGYIFGLQVARPGWYNPFQAPYFVLGAIVSGFSTMIVVAAVLRKAFKWETVFVPRLFKGLGIFLGFVTLLYMYFLFSEWLTGIYASPHHERAVFKDILVGKFASFTWTAVVGMALPFALLFIQGVNPRICSIPLTVVAALMINLSVWVMRALIVVPTFFRPLLPWDVAPYHPTASEWAMVLGSFFFFALLVAILVKTFPVLESEEKEDSDEMVVTLSMPLWKRLMIGGSVVLGVSLIATGVLLRDNPELFHPPAIWISGILVLWTVPLQICGLPDRVTTRRRREERTRLLVAGRVREKW